MLSMEEVVFLFIKETKKNLRKTIKYIFKNYGNIQKR